MLMLILVHCDNKENNNIENSETIQTFIVNGVSFDMIFVKGGTFIMGATEEQGSDIYDSEKPAHQVTLNSYSIGKTEVTQALWKAVMGNKAFHFKGDNLPVDGVSWNDCQIFIKKLNKLTGENFRLPTEAEWEFAARGGNLSKGYKYAGSNNINDVAWVGCWETQIVATKLPNELGIFDMSGNVSEWCQDWYNSYSSLSQIKPQGPSVSSRRVFQGGSWNDNSEHCWVSSRCSKPDHRKNDMGFRLCLPE